MARERAEALDGVEREFFPLARIYTRTLSFFSPSHTELARRFVFLARTSCAYHHQPSRRPPARLGDGCVLPSAAAVTQSRMVLTYLVIYGPGTGSIHVAPDSPIRPPVCVCVCVLNISDCLPYLLANYRQAFLIIEPPPVCELKLIIMKLTLKKIRSRRGKSLCAFSLTREIAAHLPSTVAL